MKRILITGAAGGAAGMLRPLLRQHYRLRLSDRRPIADATPDEEVTPPLELTDLAGLRRAIGGTDGILHFGGQPVETDFETILQSNIVGLYNTFEAARLEGVKRLVFASSNHAIGFYKRSQRIPADLTPKPDSRYGVSKVFGEAIGSLYAEKYGAEVMSIRIGNVAPKPVDVRRLSIWISPRDLAQLVRIGLDRPGIRHAIVYGVSGNTRSWWDNSAAEALGYRPEDNAEDYAAEAIRSDPGPAGDARIDDNQGGPFCVAERM